MVEISEDELRTAVLTTVRRKKNENENGPKGWLGWYHNGVLGLRHPTAELIITQVTASVYAVTYEYGGRLWHFSYSQAEIDRQETKSADLQGQRQRQQNSKQ
jgi:hypothetical protein